MDTTSREHQQRLYQLQAALCQTLADPTRLEILYLLGERPRPVKELIEATGQRQAKISQHLTVLRQRGIVQTQRIGTEIHYSLADERILDATRKAVEQAHFQHVLEILQQLRSGRLGHVEDLRGAVDIAFFLHGHEEKQLARLEPRADEPVGVGGGHVSGRRRRR